MTVRLSTRTRDKVRTLSLFSIAAYALVSFLSPFSAFAEDQELPSNLTSTIGADGKLLASKKQVGAALDAFHELRRERFRASLQELESQYASNGKDRPPIRIRSARREPLSDSVFDRLKALLRTELAMPNTDWTFVKKIVECLNGGQNDAEIVELMKLLLEKPLEPDPTRAQKSCHSTALQILGQQGSRKALKILFSCAVEPIANEGKYLPASPQLEEGEIARRRKQISGIAAQSVLISAPKEAVLPFFDAIAKLSPDDENEPFGISIDVYYEIAQRINKGDEDLGGIPEPLLRND